MPHRYRERVLPPSTLYGLALVATLVLAVAIGYAILWVLGLAIFGFVVFWLLLIYIKQTILIELDDQLRIARHVLPVSLIVNPSIIYRDSHAENFRQTVKSTDLVFGSGSYSSYLRLEIADSADPYQVWLIPTKSPTKFLAQLTNRNPGNTSDR